MEEGIIEEQKIFIEQVSFISNFIKIINTLSQLQVPEKKINVFISYAWGEPPKIYEIVSGLHHYLSQIPTLRVFFDKPEGYDSIPNTNFLGTSIQSFTENIGTSDVILIANSSKLWEKYYESSIYTQSYPCNHNTHVIYQEIERIKNEMDDLSGKEVTIIPLIMQDKPCIEHYIEQNLGIKALTLLQNDVFYKKIFDIVGENYTKSYTVESPPTLDLIFRLLGKLIPNDIYTNLQQQIVLSTLDQKDIKLFSNFSAKAIHSYQQMINLSRNINRKGATFVPTIPVISLYIKLYTLFKLYINIPICTVNELELAIIRNFADHHLEENALLTIKQNFLKQRKIFLIYKSDILNTIFSGNKLLITGEPGSGKSILCEYLLYQWTISEKLGDKLSKFDFVFLINLQHLSDAIETCDKLYNLPGFERKQPAVSTENDIAKFLSYFISNNQCIIDSKFINIYKECILYLLLNKDTENVLWIIDGEEFSSKSNCPNIAILMAYFYKQKNLIITSRDLESFPEFTKVASQINMRELFMEKMKISYIYNYIETSDGLSTDMRAKLKLRLNEWFCLYKKFESVELSLNKLKTICDILSGKMKEKPSTLLDLDTTYRELSLNLFNRAITTNSTLNFIDFQMYMSNIAFLMFKYNNTDILSSNDLYLYLDSIKIAINAGIIIKTNNYANDFRFCDKIYKLYYLSIYFDKIISYKLFYDDNIYAHLIYRNKESNDCMLLFKFIFEKNFALYEISNIAASTYFNNFLELLIDSNQYDISSYEQRLLLSTYMIQRETEKDKTMEKANLYINALYYLWLVGRLRDPSDIKLIISIFSHLDVGYINEKFIEKYLEVLQQCFQKKQFRNIWYSTLKHLNNELIEIIFESFALIINKKNIANPNISKILLNIMKYITKLQADLVDQDNSYVYSIIDKCGNLQDFLDIFHGDLFEKQVVALNKIKFDDNRNCPLFFTSDSIGAGYVHSYPCDTMQIRSQVDCSLRHIARI